MLFMMLVDDIVVFAFTSLSCVALRTSGFDPRSFLLALVDSSNAGSAASPIDNLQNIPDGEQG
jgi:Na+/H+ antiporter NhaD/arsenite permease-like protein